MKTSVSNTLRVFWVAYFITGCQYLSSSSKPTTPFAVETVEVTRIVYQTVVVPPALPNPVISESTPTFQSTIIQISSPNVTLGVEYFQGLVVITQYYTLLDKRFYEELLPLYSSSLLKRSGGKNFEADVKSVKIRFVQPYNIWLAEQGLPLIEIPANEIRYVVGTIVFHEAPAWNVDGTPMPDSKTSFVSLLLENGEWKLNELNSSPWFQ